MVYTSHPPSGHTEPEGNLMVIERSVADTLAGNGSRSEKKKQTDDAKKRAVCVICLFLFCFVLG